MPISIFLSTTNFFKIPKVPFTFNPKLVAIFLAAKLSKITKSACNSVARAIVSDLPRPKLLYNRLNIGLTHERYW